MIGRPSMWGASHGVLRVRVAVVTALLRGLFTAMLICGATAALAEGRLDAIRASGVIHLGFAETSIPFSYLGPNQRPTGYTVDICRAIAEQLKRKLNLRELDVSFTPVTASTRIPLISNGTIDLECGNSTNTPERQKLVAFAPTTFVSHTVIVARKGSGFDLNRIEAFKGKTVVTQAGSLAHKLLQQISAKENLDLTIIAASDIGQTLLTVETGRAAAGITDDGLIYAAVAASPNPAAFEIGSRGINVLPYAIMLPKGDPEFKAAVDAAVINLIRNGTVERLYDQYFNAPIPPSNINLKYPMSEDLKRALANPSDASDLSTYGTADCGACNRSGNAFMNYPWHWGAFFELSPDGVHTYLQTMLMGIEWTLALALGATLFGLTLGTVVAVMRTSSSRGLVVAGTIYVEVFRNIPLLVQMFLWYFALPELLPSSMGTVVKQMAQPWGSFVPALLCLSFYCASRMAEQVRAGIQAIPRGQFSAGRALGLSEVYVYWYIVLPQAFRLILPSLTSEFVGAVKYSSVALTIGLLELTGEARSMQELSFHIFEAFTAATIGYLCINVLIVQTMRRVERKVGVATYRTGATH